MNRFWNWVKNKDDTRTLYLDGVIADETWFEDDISPEMFKADLHAGDGEVILWINSPGGDCIAASQIYTMLMEYPHDVTIKVDGIAASAASVIAMAGTRVLMAPTALLMVHNPLTYVVGDSAEMKKAIHMLDEVKESIINAYEIKTGLPRADISRLMNAETWLSANKAVEMGFADAILYTEAEDTAPARAINVMQGFAYSHCAASNSLLTKLKAKLPPSAPAPLEPQGTPIADLDKRLAILL